MFSIQYEKQASRFLTKLTVKDDIKRIITEIEKLALNPFPTETRRVESYNDPKVFRTRVGDYRILYTVDHSQSELYILKIDKRERVY